MDNENFKKELIKRLDAVIKLLTISGMKEKSQTEKIALLSSVGFSPKEISDILNTSSNSVSVTLNKLKKKLKKEDERNDKQESDEGVEGVKENINSEALPNSQEKEKNL